VRWGDTAKLLRKLASSATRGQSAVNGWRGAVSRNKLDGAESACGLVIARGNRTGVRH